MKLFDTFSLEQKECYENYLPLVHKMAWTYAKLNPSIGSDIKELAEELFQEGALMLITAIDKYNPEKASFGTYAAIWIENGIKEYLDKSKHIVIKDSTRNSVNNVMKTKRDLEEALGRAPEIEEIAKKSGHRVSTVERYMLYMSRSVFSYDVPTNEEEKTTMKDLLENPEGDPYEAFAESELKMNLFNGIKSLLDEREKAIVFFYFRFDSTGAVEKTRTYKEVGEILQCNANTVSRQVKKICEKLAHHMAENGYSNMLSAA